MLLRLVLTAKDRNLKLKLTESLRDISWTSASPVLCDREDRGQNKTPCCEWDCVLIKAANK